MARVVIKNEVSQPFVDGNNVSLDDQSINLMVQVLNTHLNLFCQKWDIKTPQVLNYNDAQPIQQNDWIFYFQVSGDPNNTTIAFHDLNDQNIAYGVVYVDTVLNNGGFVLAPNVGDSEFVRNSPVTTVSSAVSHEIMEALVDQNLVTYWYSPINVTDFNGSYLFPGNIFVSGEVADPVESNLVLYPINNQKVAMSDYILPAWSNANANGPYNFINTLNSPFQVDNGGYVDVFFPFFGYGASIFGDKLLNRRVMRKERQIRKKNVKNNIMQMLISQREKMLNRFKSG